LAINGEKIDLDKEINESVRIVMLKRLTYDPKELRRMRLKKRLRMRTDK
jgi:putative ubiquitin-RnfH superfamily antitoxin RatB of RatAB toxin-antitoxin module